MSHLELETAIKEFSSQVDLNHPAAAARLVSHLYPQAKVRCLLRRRGSLNKLLSDVSIPVGVVAAVEEFMGESVTIQVAPW